jgi:hypothetical protein
VPPVALGPVMNAPGAKMSVSVVERCEKLATRSGPELRSCAPLPQVTEPLSASHTALIASEFGSAAG